MTEDPAGETTGAGNAAAWTFTDDFGDTVTLDSQPERVVAFEDVAASLLDLGVRPVGIQYINGVGGNQLFDGFDLDGIATVGETCDGVNLEALAAQDPDVLVWMRWGNDDGAFCLPAEQLEVIRADIAPVILIKGQGEADQLLARYVELAGALGADLDSAEINAKRERYEAAATRLEAAVAGRPEISVIAVSIAPDWAGVAEPAGFADLVTLRDRFGVEFAGPFEADEFTGEYWQELSAETITSFRGDVILMDSKNETPFEDKVAAQPLWAALPEVEAGQIVPWFVPGSFSYTRDAIFMESLAEAIEKAEDLVS